MGHFWAKYSSCDRQEALESERLSPGISYPDLPTESLGRTAGFHSSFSSTSKMGIRISISQNRCKIQMRQAGEGFYKRRMPCISYCHHQHHHHFYRDCVIITLGLGTWPVC